MWKAHLWCLDPVSKHFDYVQAYLFQLKLNVLGGPCYWGFFFHIRHGYYGCLGPSHKSLCKISVKFDVLKYKKILLFWWQCNNAYCHYVTVSGETDFMETVSVSIAYSFIKLYSKHTDVSSSTHAFTCKRDLCGYAHITMTTDTRLQIGLCNK